MLKDILVRVMFGVIAALVLLLGTLGWAYSNTKEERDDYKEKLTEIKASSQAAQKRYRRYMESYDSAMTDIVAFYEKEKLDVKNFKRGTNETNCEAAHRLLKRLRS